MSQPFEARLVVVGSPEAAAAFSDRLIKDWDGDQPPPGFRWLQKERPRLDANKSQSNVQNTYSFIGNGPAPERWAVALSSEFPSLRISFMAADSSNHEWLACAIAAYAGTWARARLKIGESGFPRPRSDRALLHTLATKVYALHKVIGDDAELTEAHKSALCADYECGKLWTSLFQAPPQRRSRKAAT